MDKDRKDSLKPVEVLMTPEDLLGTIQSAEFKRALGLSANITFSTGMESGFTVNLLPDNKERFIESVRTGDGSSMRYDAQSEIRLDDRVDISVGLIGTYIRFHFHPESDGPIIPSSGEAGDDLYQFSAESESDAGYLMTAKIDESRNITILVIRRPSIPMDSYDFEYFYSDIEGVITTEEVADILSKRNLPSTVINFKRTNRGYKLTDYSPEEIAKIGNVSVRCDSPVMRMDE
jgi:hypothetical protein